MGIVKLQCCCKISSLYRYQQILFFPLYFEVFRSYFYRKDLLWKTKVNYFFGESICIGQVQSLFHKGDARLQHADGINYSTLQNIKKRIAPFSLLIHFNLCWIKFSVYIFSLAYKVTNIFSLYQWNVYHQVFTYAKINPK